ncbi:MAG: dihydropteroate synthase [Bryobacterales bacterium]|nr:dihydropteroate synthase [Bryobacterales bacterium]
MRTAIMGILNVTPDSFSDGGRFGGAALAAEEGRRMFAAGASIVDVGGESTRPGAAPVSEDAELERVLPVVRLLAGEGGGRVSVDTMKPRVAGACLSAGATLVNDVSGLRDPEMIEAAASHRAGVVIMHMRGTPQTMREHAVYTDVVREIKAELAPRIEAARRAGISEVLIDPGLGFAKTAAQSFEILRRLREFEDLGCPIMIGPSRKSFLGTIDGMEQPGERLEGTLAAVAIGVLHGARFIRAHDVAACRKAAAVAEAVMEAQWTRSC